MQSDAATVDAYLKEIPPAQMGLVRSLRDIVLRHLPDGYCESMRWGMISYEVPMEVSGPTYNGQPLMYAAIGAQKYHVSLYLCGLYCREGLLAQFLRDYPGKPDMGKSCLRLRKESQIDERSIARALVAMSPAEYAAFAAQPRNTKSP